MKSQQLMMSVASLRSASRLTSKPSTIPSQATNPPRTLLHQAYSLWLFTVSDLKTIVIPKTAFGTITLLSGTVLTKSPRPAWLPIVRCLPWVMMWTWLNLLPLAMNNQHREADVEEDKKNKPWRPIPAGRLSIEETKHLVLASYVAAILGSAYLGALPECLALIVQGWIYNELGAANDSYLTRNVLNATGYMTSAAGAAKVACMHSGTTLQRGVYIWYLLLGAVIATAIQCQDLYDQEGDSARGRRTIPLVVGDGSARLSVGLPIAVWSLLCPTFWRLDGRGFLLPIILGAVVIFRLFRHKGVSADKTSFKIWNAWVVLLYLLPFLKAIAQ